LLTAVAATALVPVALLVVAHHPALSLGVVLGAAARRVADVASRRLRPLVARRSGPPSA